MVFCNYPAARFAHTCACDSTCNAVMHQECMEDDQGGVVDRPTPGPEGQLFCSPRCQKFWNAGPAADVKEQWKRTSFQSRWRLYDTFQAHFGKVTPSREGFEVMDMCLHHHVKQKGRFEDFLSTMRGISLADKTTQFSDDLPTGDQKDLGSLLKLVKQHAPQNPPQTLPTKEQAGGSGS